MVPQYTPLSLSSTTKLTTFFYHLINSSETPVSAKHALLFSFFLLSYLLA